MDNDFQKVQFPLCTNYNRCKVHLGFYSAYKQLQNQVKENVKKYMTKFEINQVIIAGHSMGGPLATLAAIDLISIGINVKYLYTFGSFRVGDFKFAQWYKNYDTNMKSFRVTNGRDPIVHMPQKIKGFNHINHQIFYFDTPNKNYISCSDEGLEEDPNCSDKHKINNNVYDHVNYFGINFTQQILQCRL